MIWKLNLIERYKDWKLNNIGDACKEVKRVGR
jgi:hypothetical protein